MGGEVTTDMTTETQTALALHLEVQQFERRCGQTLPRAAALEALSGGAMTMGRLAEALGLANSTCTHLVDMLVQRGLARRAQRQGDRRSVWLERTGTESVTGALELYRRANEYERHAGGRVVQLAVLLALRAHGGPMTVGALGRALTLSPGAMTCLLDRMEGYGLIQRERRADDRRSILVELTAGGR